MEGFSSGSFTYLSSAAKSLVKRLDLSDDFAMMCKPDIHKALEIVCGQIGSQRLPIL